MILVRRKDNHTINLDAAVGTTPHPDGLIVETPGAVRNEYWLVEGYSLDQLIKDTEGRWGHLLVIHREFRSWPS